MPSMDDVDAGRAEAMKEVERHLRTLADAQTGARNGDATAPAQAPAQAPAKPLPIDWSTEGTPAYANGMQILHRATEFALVFTDMAAFPGRLSPDGRAGNERAAVVASLRIAP